MRLEVLFTPAEFEALRPASLGDTVCVVFDILRATSSIVTALAHGATDVRPVATVAEALAELGRDPAVLLAGEREGVRIGPDLTGGRWFDLGNSPREFEAQTVRGRRIVMTTTNGTRALAAVRGARRVLAASFLNLEATARALEACAGTRVLVVCSGTQEEASFEDALAAGALVDRLIGAGQPCEVHDSAQIARCMYRQQSGDLLAGMAHARNGRRLLAMPELAADVAWSLRRDVFDGIAEARADGTLVWQPVTTSGPG